MNSPRLPAVVVSAPAQPSAFPLFARGGKRPEDDVPGGGPIRLVADASTYAAVGAKAEESWARRAYRPA